MPAPLLFTEMALRELALRNRVVVSPMLQYRGENGFATDWHLVHAGRYAAGGAGLVMMESTKVERRGCGTTGDIGIWDDAFIPGLKRIVDFVHGEGAAIGVQLGHSGRRSRRAMPWQGGKPLEPSPDIADWDEWELIAPSPTPGGEGNPAPRALARNEIPEVVEAFAKAAVRADAAGYDTVEIHAAHGFLIHQFLSPEANRRNDDYGGSLENRMRFAIEVVEAVRAVWPEDKPLFMRMSVEDDSGWGPADSAALARIIGPKGVDVIDCSAGGITGRPLAAYPPAYGYQVPLSEAVRRDGKIKTMAVGLIVHAAQAERILADGRADLVALGREMLYNPNWALDAAFKLGAEDPLALAPYNHRGHLAGRLKAVPDFHPSTYAPDGAAD